MSILLLFLVSLKIVFGLHLEGTWKPVQRYRFLTKFGFQRTQIDELQATRGYIYGTIKMKDPNIPDPNSSDLATLVLVDSEFILPLYGNASKPMWPQNSSYTTQEEALWDLETKRCRWMFGKVDKLAWHRTCAPQGQMDLLRSIPCPRTELCDEEDDSRRVIKDSQFTYTVQDLKQPRYWYLSLVACKRNPTTCEWETTSVPKPGSNSSLSPTHHSITYSIWLVNGEPRLQKFILFQHQFSFELHYTAEMYLVFLAVYLFLSTIAHVKLITFPTPHVILLLAHLWISTLGILLTAAHLGVFAFDGRGLGYLSDFGVVISQIADSIFLALIIYTAQIGFRSISITRNPTIHDQSLSTTSDYSHMKHNYSYDYHRLSTTTTTSSQFSHITSSTDESRPNNNRNLKSWSHVISLVVLFVSVQNFLYTWALFDQDPVIDHSVWNTVPGCLLLAMRFLVAFWFLTILRRRFNPSHTHSKSIPNINNSTPGFLETQIDMVHFAAGFLLWIIVLPVVIFITETSVSPLWRHKTVTSLSLCANFVAVLFYIYFLWRSESSEPSGL